MATGRTVSKWVLFKVDDTVPTLRTIAVNSINVCGITYEEHDLTAFQDAVKGALPGMPDAPVEIGGPWDNTALTGSHTVLSAIVGLSVPLALAVCFGMRAAWVSGTDVNFGITGTADNGYLCTAYNVDPSTMTYTARFVVAPGSAIPTFTTVAIT
jgi:hypothetical protein